MIHNQLLMFSIYIITGLLLSFVFDFFRILRKCIKTSNLATYIEDIFFWIIVFVTLLLISNKFKYMEFRFYNFFGLVIGSITYFIFFDKFVLKIGTKVLKIILKIGAKFFRVVFKVETKILKVVRRILSFFEKIIKDFVKICRNKK